MKRAILVVLLVCLSTVFLNAAGLPSQGASSDRIKVYIDGLGAAAIGPKVVNALKEKIASSPKFTLADDSDSAEIDVILSSLEVGGTSGATSAIAVAFVLKPALLRYYANSTVATCGLAMVEVTAERILTDVDKAYNDQREDAEYLLTLAKKGFEKK